MDRDAGSDARERAEAQVVVRRATEGDWAHLRAVRLAALADSPSAFGSTLSEEQEYTEEDWREWARDWATFLAYQQRSAIGIVAGIGGDTAAERKLIAMWVDPAHRGTGVASALVEAVKAWARDDGATRLMLWVTLDNHAATGLYRSSGFTETGSTRTLPSTTALMEVQLSLALIQVPA